MSTPGLEAAPSSNRRFSHRAECLQVSKSLCAEMQQAPAVVWRSQGPGASYLGVTLDDLKFFLLQYMWSMCLVSQSLSQSAQSWVGWGCRKEEERSCMGDCLKLVCCPHPTDHWDSSILPRSVLRPNHTFCQVLTVWRLRRAWVGFLMSSWGDWSQIPLFPVFYDNVNVINALTCSDWRVPAFLWWTTQKK